MSFPWMAALNLGTTVASGVMGARGPGSSKALREARKSQKAARKYAEWAAQPESTAFKNLEGLFKEANRRRAVEMTELFRKSSLRARSRGDPAFLVNPERRDESRSRALLHAFQRAGEAARLEARDTLLNASRAAAGAAAAGGQIAGLDQRLKGQQFAGKLIGLGAIGPALTDLFEGFSVSPDITSGGAPLPRRKPEIIR